MNNLKRVKALENRISVSTARGERSFVIVNSISGFIDVSYTGTILKNGKQFDENIPNAKGLTPEIFQEYRNQYFNDDDTVVNIIPASQKVNQ